MFPVTRTVQQYTQRQTFKFLLSHQQQQTRSITTRAYTVHKSQPTTFFQQAKARPRVLHRRNTQQFSTHGQQHAATTGEEQMKEPTIEHLNSPPQEGFVSRALRPKARAKYKNLPISQRKLEYLSKLIRGLNVREAIIQLRLSQKRKTYFLRKALRTLANTAMNTFNMNKDRLYISEIYSTRGKCQRKIEYRARGRANLRVSRKSHLFLTVAEQPYHKGEIRIGRYGRTIERWRQFDKLAEAWKLKKAMEIM